MSQSTDFAQLRAFVAVGDALNFSRAAEALGVSPSALSQLVRSLEQRVGVRLLNRSTRSVSLTEAGRALLARVKPAVATLGDAIAEVRESGEKPSGVVRVHSFRSAAETYVQPMLAAFRSSYPGVTLDLTLDDNVIDIVAEGYDVAIRLGEVIEKDMIAVRLGEDLRQVVVASPAYLARHGEPKSPKDLRDHACIRWRWPGDTIYNWEFHDGERWFSVAVEGPLIVNDKKVAIEAAAAGIGLTFAVERLVAPFIASGRLVPLLEKWCAPFPGFFVCYPEQRQMAPAIRAFIDAVKESAAAAGKKVLVPVAAPRRRRANTG